jgi:starvation-inducible DNA-binding protein
MSEAAEIHAPLNDRSVPSGLSDHAIEDTSAAVNVLLADVFALYLQTKNFHWHVSGPHFCDYHLLLEEQADKIFAMTDPIAERVRRICGTTLRSIGQVARLHRPADNDAQFVEADDMLNELTGDNRALAGAMRMIHGLCDELNDVSTASLLENWIGETEQHTWFLFEVSRLNGHR